MGGKIKNINYISLELVYQNSKVLDVGCGDGTLGLKMIKKYKSIVIGVEIDANLATIAKNKLTKIIKGNIEEEKIINQIKKLGPFDIIFASAILEHTKNPFILINKLSKMLKKNGYFIITLPNIAYWRIRLALFLGKFDYQESGILDKTHLHFFTLKSARSFIRDNSLIIDHIGYEFPAFPIIDRIFRSFPFLGDTALNILYKCFPSFFAYQFLFKAKIADEKL